MTAAVTPPTDLDALNGKLKAIRRQLRDELLTLNRQIDFLLIFDHEERLIREQWEKDQTTDVLIASKSLGWAEVTTC